MLFSRFYCISALFLLMLPAAVPAQFTFTTNNGAITITQYTGTSPAPIIPSTTNGYPVVAIGGSAFLKCASLTSVTIPDSVTNIGSEAFDYCSSLTNVTIPGSVTAVGSSAFSSCSSLASVTISKGVTGIGAFAFFGCASLTSVTIPNSVTNIADYAFESCTSLKSAYFPGNAPPGNGTVFYLDPATVYYLPGMSGWAATFGGVPAVLWNPKATAFTTAGGQFGFNITGPTNAAIVVEVCTNLASPFWLPVSTNTLSSSGTSSFSDLQSTNCPNRYYRFTTP